MRRLCLMLARLCMGAWVGAALFFVSVSIRPMRSVHFDSEARAQLAQMLFPGYYAFGFGLMLAAIVTSIASGRGTTGSDRLRRGLSLSCSLGALAIMLVDWFWIYGPLARMISAEVTEHVALPSSFRSYHVASMLVNSGCIGLSIISVALLSWPETSQSSRDLQHSR